MLPHRSPFLVGDVGGTKTILAVAQVGPQGVAVDPKTVVRFASVAYPHLRDLVADYLRMRPRPQIRWACLGVPGPVVGNRCRTTNLPWDLHAEELAEAWGFHQVMLINDLAALGWALTQKPFPAYRTLHPGTPVPGEPRLVVAVGTGLGAALVVETPRGFTVLATEAGHCDFCAKTTDDWQLAAWLHAQVGSVSYEHVVSGPGLARLYRYVSLENPNPAFLAAPDPADWVLRYAESDPLCARAATLCIRYLGTFLGDLALVTLPLAGVFLAGSVASGLAPWLGLPEFSRAFQDKDAHHELLAQIPVYLLEDPLAPLLGCAYAWLAA